MIVENESILRGLFFASGLAFFYATGLFRSFRRIDIKRDRIRWINNLALTFFNTFLIKFFIPLSLAEFAMNWSDWGLLNFMTSSIFIKTIISLIALDLLIYWQHRIFHTHPVLWRLHRVHHTDIGFDTTTALRFHPFEIFLSILIKAAFILFFGVPASAIILFEVVLNFAALFHHGNFSLPQKIEEKLNKWIVTPDYHRIHHSVYMNETNSNYAFFLSIWDRTFKSHNATSKDNPKNMDIGIEEFRKIEDQGLLQMLRQPFR